MNQAKFQLYWNIHETLHYLEGNLLVFGGSSAGGFSDISPDCLYLRKDTGVIDRYLIVQFPDVNISKFAQACLPLVL